MIFILPCILLLFAYLTFICIRKVSYNKTTLFSLLTLSIISQSLYCYFALFNYQIFSSDIEKIHPEYFSKRCGIVTKHIEGFETGEKSSSTYKEYLVIKYDDNISERISVERNLYDKYSDNKRICFKINTDSYDNCILIVLFFGILGALGLIFQLIFVLECQ